MAIQAATTIELRHFFVTPGVAAAHALSGAAICCRSRERSKDNATLYSRFDSPQSYQRRLYLGHYRHSCCHSLFYVGTASKLVHVVDPAAAMFVVNALRLGGNSYPEWALS